MQINCSYTSTSFLQPFSVQLPSHFQCPPVMKVVGIHLRVRLYKELRVSQVLPMKNFMADHFPFPQCSTWGYFCVFCSMFLNVVLWSAAACCYTQTILHKLDECSLFLLHKNSVFPHPRSSLADQLCILRIGILSTILSLSLTLLVLCSSATHPASPLWKFSYHDNAFLHCIIMWVNKYIILYKTVLCVTTIYIKYMLM